MTPMTIEAATEMVDELALLKFFPAESASARIALAKMLLRIVPFEEQGRWLTQRMLDLFSEWPGPQTLRLVFSTRFQPKDGDIGCPHRVGSTPCAQCTAAFLPQKPMEQYMPTMLPPGHAVTADRQLDDEIKALAVQKQMPGLRRRV